MSSKSALRNGRLSPSASFSFMPSAHYLRTSCLLPMVIGPGDRKSVQPMAERVALGGYDQLHHFIAAGVWDAGPVETELLIQADKLVGGSDAVLGICAAAIP